MSTDTPAPQVSFVVDDDDDAHRISAILEALGFEAIRSMESENAMHWGLVRLVRKYKISAREKAVLELMLREQPTDEQLARRIETSIHTVKFLRNQIFIKTGVTTREQLLRLTLQLPVLPATELAAAAGNNPPAAL